MEDAKNGEKSYKVFTEEQEKIYRGFNEAQRKYFDARAAGYTKADAFRMTGRVVKKPNVSAAQFERTNPIVVSLLNVLKRSANVQQVVGGGKGEGELNQKLNALATQDSVKRAIEKIEGADSETAKRIVFYRDIIDGKIKTVRKTKRFSGDGKLIETKVEEVSDIELRIKARKELDNILGLESVLEMGKVAVGDITINIVDASKKEELEDDRNKVIIGKSEMIDGEEVIVVDEKEEGGGKSE